MQSRISKRQLQHSVHKRQIAEDVDSTRVKLKPWLGDICCDQGPVLGVAHGRLLLVCSGTVCITYATLGILFGPRVCVRRKQLVPSSMICVPPTLLSPDLLWLLFCVSSEIAERLNVVSTCPGIPFYYRYENF